MVKVEPMEIIPSTSEKTSPEPIKPHAIHLPTSKAAMAAPKLSLLERRDVKRVKPIRPIPTYLSEGSFDYLSSPISPTLALHSPLSKMDVSTPGLSPHAPASAPAFPSLSDTFQFPPTSFFNLPAGVVSPIPIQPGSAANKRAER
eukprot:sb/3473939/